MNRKATETEYSRLEVITSEFLLALRESGVPSAYRVRNLVLDYYSTERGFIRLFQIKVDARLASPIAKCWDLAVNADHDWAFRDMSSQIIEQFDDNWTTCNRLLATRIMQSIGKWKRLSPDPTWEARIIEHFALTSAAENQSTIHVAKYADSDHAQARYIQQSKSSTGSSLSPKQAQSNRPFPARHTDPKNATASRSGLASVLTLILFPTLMAIIGLISNQPSQQQANQESSAASSGDMQIDKNFNELQARLSQYKNELFNARLVCELDAVAGRMKALATDARQINAVAVAQESEQIASQALNRITELKQPGKEQYWESCEEGVGFQSYDKYEWIYGGDYKGKFFAVAKKECIRPAVAFNLYADKDLKRKIHSQWIRFKPSEDKGTADNVNVTVPADSLPKSEGSRVWWSYEVRCNYEG